MKITQTIKNTANGIKKMIQSPPKTQEPEKRYYTNESVDDYERRLKSMMNGKR